MYNLTLTEYEKLLVEQALNTSLSSLYSALYDFNTKDGVLEVQDEIQACKELLQRLRGGRLSDKVSMTKDQLKKIGNETLKSYAETPTGIDLKHFKDI